MLIFKKQLETLITEIPVIMDKVSDLEARELSNEKFNEKLASDRTQIAIRENKLADGYKTLQAQMVKEDARIKITDSSKKEVEKRLESIKKQEQELRKREVALAKLEEKIEPVKKREKALLLREATLGDKEQSVDKEKEMLVKRAELLDMKEKKLTSRANQVQRAIDSL